MSNFRGPLLLTRIDLMSVVILAGAKGILLESTLKACLIYTEASLAAAS